MASSTSVTFKGTELEVKQKVEEFLKDRDVKRTYYVHTPKFIEYDFSKTPVYEKWECKIEIY